MNLSVRNVKSMQGHEGMAFSLTLCLDGKPVATVRNDGNGGENFYDWTAADGRMWGGPTAARVKAWVQTLPPVPVPWEGHDPLPMNLDLYVEELLNRHQEEAQLRRWCRTKVVFAMPGDKPGEYHTYAAPYSTAVADRIRATYPGAEVVNERFGFQQARKALVGGARRSA